MSRTNPRYHRINPLGTAVGTTYGLVRYAIQGTIENQMTINVFDWWNTVPSLSPSQMSVLLGHISTGIFASYKALLSADWTCVKESLNMIHRNDIAGLNSTSNAGAVGGRAAGHMPTEVAQPCIRYTSLKGQHGRGRLSLPAIAASDVGLSKITAGTWITAFNTFAAACLSGFLDGTNPNNWLGAVTTRSTVVPKLAQYFTQIQGVVMSPYLGTIRRRKIGRGK